MTFLTIDEINSNPEHAPIDDETNFINRIILSKKDILLSNYMKDILETHPVINLKAILRKMKQDVGSYSKMKKDELIKRIMELKKKGFPVPKVEKYVKPARKKAPEPKKPEPKKPEPKVFKFQEEIEETEKKLEFENKRLAELRKLIDEEKESRNKKKSAGKRTTRAKLNKLEDRYLISFNMKEILKRKLKDLKK